MKYLIVLFSVTCLFSCVSCLQYDKGLIKLGRERLRKVAEECKRELNTPTHVLERILAREFPRTREGRCLIACGHKKLGIQGTDGKLDPVGAIAALDQLKQFNVKLYAEAKKSFEKCLSKVPNHTDECLTASKWVICNHIETKGTELEDYFSV